MMPFPSRSQKTYFELSAVRLTPKSPSFLDKRVGNLHLTGLGAHHLNLLREYPSSA